MKRPYEVTNPSQLATPPLASLHLAMNPVTYLTQKPVRRRVGLILLFACGAGTAALLAQQPATPPAAAPAPSPSASDPELKPVPINPQPEPLSPTLGAPPPLASPAGLPPLPTAPPPPAAVAPALPAPSIEPASPTPLFTPAQPPRAPSAKRLPAANRYLSIQPGKLPGRINSAAVAGTTLDLDVNADPRSAAEQYHRYLAEFDSQREAAAHAVFGLAEAYRKMGRIDEARIQYGRILREFVDFPELAGQSQKLLAENSPGKGPLGMMSRSPDASQLASSKQAIDEERELVLQEVQLLETELERVKARISQGVEPPNTVVPIQREILQLKQRLVRLRPDDQPSAAPKPKRGQ